MSQERLPEIYSGEKEGTLLLDTATWREAVARGGGVF